MQFQHKSGTFLETFSTDNPAPANTTGRFIPSVKELALLYGFDADNVYTDAYSEGNYRITDMDADE